MTSVSKKKKNNKNKPKEKKQTLVGIPKCMQNNNKNSKHLFLKRNQKLNKDKSLAKTKKKPARKQT